MLCNVFIHATSTRNLTRICTHIYTDSATLIAYVRSAFVYVSVCACDARARAQILEMALCTASARTVKVASTCAVVRTAHNRSYTHTHMCVHNIRSRACAYNTTPRIAIAFCLCLFTSRERARTNIIYICARRHRTPESCVGSAAAGPPYQPGRRRFGVYSTVKITICSLI